MDELAAASAAVSQGACVSHHIEFTESDRTADMVAIFNDLDKHFLTRLLFSGKVARTRLWRQMLETLLQKRLSKWQHAVFFGKHCPRSNGVGQGLKGRALQGALAEYAEECSVADELLSRARVPAAAHRDIDTTTAGGSHVGYVDPGQPGRDG